MKDNILNRKFKYSFVSAYIYIVLVNVFVFFVTNFLNIRIYGIPLEYWLCLSHAGLKSGYVWQLVTYMFVHSDLMHFLFNMYALLMFGSTVERALGSKEFLLYYFICGVLGGAICLAGYKLLGFDNVFVLGSSGAVYALLFLAGVLFPTNRILLFFFIPMKLIFAVVIFMFIEILEQVADSSDGISHLVHLSSIVIGYIYCVVRFRISPFKVFKEALKR